MDRAPLQLPIRLLPRKGQQIGLIASFGLFLDPIAVRSRSAISGMTVPVSGDAIVRASTMNREPFPDDTIYAPAGFRTIQSRRPSAVYGGSVVRR